MSSSGWMNWLQRAGKKIDARDLLLLTPPGVLRLIAGFVGQRRSVAATGAEVPPPELHARDPELLEIVHDLFRALGQHYFRLQLRGTEHLPSHGPAMLVGSHNGAVLPIDTMFTMLGVRDTLGPERIVHPLAHDGIYANPHTRRYMQGLGVLRAGHSASDAALEQGHLVLVYPGSDWDCCRSFAQRGRIELAGRTGFLKQALRHQVPIIPVVSAGTHEQLIVLTRGEGLAKALRLHKLMRLDTFPIVLSLPWGLTSGLLPYIPLPAQTTVAFGPPISLPLVPESQVEDPQLLRHCYDLVTSRMQAQLDQLMAGRRVLLGQRHAGQ